MVPVTRVATSSPSMTRTGPSPQTAPVVVEGSSGRTTSTPVSAISGTTTCDASGAFSNRTRSR